MFLAEPNTAAKKKCKRTKHRLRLSDIPNMHYNAMKLKVKKMSDADLRDCIELLKQGMVANAHFPTLS